MRKRLSASERHERKRAEHKRYYAQTANRYKGRRWTEEEDRLVLAHTITDRELSEAIRRSMKAIQNRRAILREARWAEIEREDAMEMGNLPEMSDEQRRAALECAAEARRVRKEFKDLVKKGRFPLRMPSATNARSASTFTRS